MRLLQCAMAQYTDPSGIPRTGFFGEEVNPSTAEEERLEELGLLAPVGATLATVEAKSAQRSQEYTAWASGTGPPPVERPRTWD